MSEIHDATEEGPIVSATTPEWGNLSQLRLDLFREIMSNTVDGDDCAYCIAYRHAAMIVLGQAVAVPPEVNTVVEDHAHD